MKKLVLAVLLFPTFALAAPNSEEYTIKAHVTASHWSVAPTTFGSPAVQRLEVTIEGKKFVLEAPAREGDLGRGVTLLALGDYKGKLVQDVHKSTYESSQAYEFLFPDNKTRKFFVVGQFE